ncbi:FkbM family methyltransferase [Helicobacter sp. MIT 21-1697]|nr:FkbM family methyltransferase [Helicobacter sp. MIT 21-1697]
MLHSTHSDNPIVFLNNCGLGANEQTMTLYSNAQGSGLASLTQRRLTHHNIDFNQSEQVHITTLDKYCVKAQIPHIHLLKIDVEGHELDVLNGALGMFKDDSIDMVTFEFGGCNIDTRTYFQDFWYFFQTYNMNIYRILPNQSLYHIASYNESREQFDTTNYVAISAKYGIFK